MTHTPIKAFIFVARSDKVFIEYTLPHLIDVCRNGLAEVTVIIDTKKPGGILGNFIKQYDLSAITNVVQQIQKSHPFTTEFSFYENIHIKQLNKKQLGYPYKETHCFRGYPIYGSFKQFFDTEAKYILHLDCDMIFYEEPDFSWLKEGVRVMEENDDILCVLPKGGPPKIDGELYQGSTPYRLDEKRKLYLFKNFTSRHYLIHRERFLSLLPLKPLWLSWREPFKSRFFGNGKLLCWESIVGEALNKSQFWRADLLTDKAWSLHAGDRSDQFYAMLPKIINSVRDSKFPDKQRGHYDLCMTDWTEFLINS